MAAPEDEPLWPAYYTPGMLVDAQADDFKWKTLYMQSPPSDEGVWADSQDVQITPMPHGVVGNDDWRIYIGVDLAYSVNKGDYTVVRGHRLPQAHRRDAHCRTVAQAGRSGDQH